MRKHIYIIIATSLLLGDYVYATDIHYLMKDLRNQRVVSEDLVVIAKEAFKNKHQEYGSAKKLYSEAKRKYNTYVDDLLFALQFEELRSLNDSAIEAKEKADLFEEYVRKEAQTLSIGPFIAQFGDTIVNCSIPASSRPPRTTSTSSRSIASKRRISMWPRSRRRSPLLAPRWKRRARRRRPQRH